MIIYYCMIFTFHVRAKKEEKEPDYLPSIGKTFPQRKKAMHWRAWAQRKRCKSVKMTNTSQCKVFNVEQEATRWLA